MTFNGRSNPAAIALADKLLSIAPVPMSKVFFANSGSEANDTAVKLVWYYYNAIGKPAKKKIISRKNAHHGVTVAAASLSGLVSNHRDFDLPIDRILHVECPHHYRFGEPGESEEAFATRLAESICGFCRTGEMFGSTTFGLKPDILTAAKALSSGYIPISAEMVNGKVHAAIAANSGKISTFGHGFTYSGHPVACAIALETLKIYEDDVVLSRVKSLAPRFQQGLRQYSSRSFVGEVRGVGLIGAIELVADKAHRTSFEPAKKMGARLAALALEEGLVVRPLNDAVAFCPPLVIRETEIDEMFNRFGRAMTRFEAMPA